MDPLQAYCDACAAATVVQPEDVLEFDVRCPTCGEGTLVLRWSARRVLQAAAPTAASARTTGGSATWADAARAVRLAGEPARDPAPARPSPPPPPPAPPPPPPPAAGPPEPAPLAPPEPASLVPEPFPGEDELDPFEAAARKLDRSVTESMKRRRPGRGDSGSMGRPTGLGPIETRPTRAMPQETPGPGLVGVAPPAPPLPAWDGGDTSRVVQLAREVPRPAESGPVNLESQRAGAEGPASAPTPPGGALPVEVVQLDGGTRGTGSRTYDRGELGATAGGPLPPAPLTAPTPASSGPVARIEDSDWLALIDELTEEPAAPGAPAAPEGGPSRVFIRLPEELAPTDVASQEQVARFQATVRQLEEKGGTQLARLMGEGEPLTPSGGRPRGLEDPPTRPHGADDPPTRPWEDTNKEKREEPVSARPWEDTAKEKRSEETRVTPALGNGGNGGNRAEPSTPEASGQMIKEFPHQDLDPALVCARDATSPRADAFRQLYQRVFHSGRETPPRVVLITSPEPGAGKTTVAANLAVVAARIPGRGAVLVDADPRGRGVLRYFGVRRRAEGLLDALQAEGTELRAHVLQFNLGTLDVVPLGIKGSDAPELIASDRLMGAFLERVRGAYPNSVVLIDGSPVLQAADPLVLARLADGVVLVVRAGHTAREDVKRALDLLGPEKVLGVVLNDAAA